MTTTLERNETVQNDWYVVDATDQIVGRFATKLATVLMGKHKPSYTPHVDTGDYIIVLNAHLVRFTGADEANPHHPGFTSKMARKEYQSYSGYPSGQKIRTGVDIVAKKPDFFLHEAVRRMLPKSKLGTHMLKKLRLVNGSEHSHQAQEPQPLPEYLYK